ASLSLLIPFHRHRWIVFRRVFTIAAVLYFGRCLTLLLTQLPVADPNWRCSPKLEGRNATLYNAVIRALSFNKGFGLNIGSDKVSLCGDYIYSGHTIVLVLFPLFIGKYTPRRWRLIHFLSWLISIIGMFLLIASRGHYTIDVVISYVLTTRIFHIYHAMAVKPNLRV
ncbi:hypothetical protein PMAYCL1PPCAC_15600, partial [Pristionchus mayeri]